MKYLVSAFAFFVVFATSVDAQQPLQADLNPALYVPYAQYYDQGSGQNFYYDSSVGSFMIGQAPPAAYAVSSYAQPSHSLIDQAACQMKANFLALTGVFSHGSSVVGAFEGIGTGPSPSCATCVPSYGMTLSGDASAQGANGMWYRVRSWR